MKNYIGLSATDQQCCSRRLSKGLHAKSMAWLWLYQAALAESSAPSAAKPAGRRANKAARVVLAAGQSGSCQQRSVAPQPIRTWMAIEHFEFFPVNYQIYNHFITSNDFCIYLTAIIICKWLVIG